MSRQSIAGRVYLDNSVAIENDVPEEKHHRMYEMIPDEEGSTETIQKMVAVPILAKDGSVVGVFEVSRVGRNLREAGKDFEEEDAENLVKLTKVFAPFTTFVFKKLWPALA